MDLTVCDRLLTTTRSVRKRLDLEKPVDLAVIRECIDVATQAPTGGNNQGWHWLVVTDPVTVASAIESGEVSPLVKRLAEVLYDALAGLLAYL